jgi:phytoene/squalene synthetase
MHDRAQYIAELVRREDRDRYILALFAPASVRQDVMALYAFNAEMAKIRTSVSETMIGRIKLQWWRDVIEGIYAGRGAPKGNPVTEALAEAITVRELSKSHFESIIATREQEIDAEGSVDMEAFAEGTSARLIDLVLEVLGSPATPAASHAGIAYGMARLIRAARMHDPNLEFSTYVATARDHFSKARTMQFDGRAVPALLHATIAEQYLNSENANVRPSILRLIWNAWRGKF